MIARVVVFIGLLGFLSHAAYGEGRLDTDSTGIPQECRALKSKLFAPNNGSTDEIRDLGARLRECAPPGTKLYAYSYAGEAWTLAGRGLHEQVLERARAMTADAAVQDSALIGYISEEAGYAAHMMGDDARALYWLRHGVNHSVVRETYKRINIRRTLALQHIRNIRFDDAQRVLQPALAMADTAQISDLRLARLYLTAGGIPIGRWIAGKKTSVSDGLPFVKKTAALLTILDPEKRRATEYQHLIQKAGYLLAQGDSETARAQLSDVLAKARKHRMPRVEATALLRIGWMALHRGKAEAALDALDASEAVINEHGIGDLRAVVLGYQVEAAAMANNQSLAHAALSSLNGLDAPGARHHQHRASVIYLEAFENAAGSSVLPWLGTGAALLVLLGLAGAALPRVRRSVVQQARRSSDRAPTPRSSADASFPCPPPSTFDLAAPAAVARAVGALTPSPEDPADPNDGPAPHSLAFPDRWVSDPSADASSDGNPPHDAEESDDTGSAKNDAHSDPEEATSESDSASLPDAPPPPVHRADPEDAHPLTQDADWLGDGHRGVPPELSMTPDEADAEHRRLLFTLWGIPPGGTEARVALPLYRPDGLFVGTRSVPASLVQAQLRQSLFLLQNDDTVDLVYVRHEDTTAVIRSIDRDGIHGASTSMPIRGFPLVAFPPHACKVER